MKHTKFFAILFSLFIIGASDASAAAVTDTIRVPEMQCGMCETKIEKGLKKAAYISSIEADAEQDIVVVTYDNTKGKRADIEKLIAMTGYATENVPADKTAQAALHGCCQPGAHEEPETPTTKKVIQKAAPKK